MALPSGRVFIWSWCWDSSFRDRHLRAIFAPRHKKQTQRCIPGKPIRCGPGKPNQTKERSEKSSMWIVLAFLRKNIRIHKNGRNSRTFCFGPFFSLVWFAGATPETKRSRCLGVRCWDPSLSSGYQNCGLGIHCRENFKIVLGETRSFLEALYKTRPSANRAAWDRSQISWSGPKCLGEGARGLCLHRSKDVLHWCKMGRTGANLVAQAQVTFGLVSL